MANGGARPFNIPTPWGGGRQGLGTRILNAGKAQQKPPVVKPVRPVAPKPVMLSSVAQQPQPAQPASPLDAEYYNNRNMAQFQVGQQINALNAQGANEKAALGERLRLMAEQQPLLRQNATNSANSRGLLYSGALGNQIGNLETQYLRNQSSANNLYSQHEAARQAQIAGIQGQQGFDDLAAQLAAISRGQSLAAQAPPSAPTSPPSVAKLTPGRPRNPATPAKPTPVLRPLTKQGLGTRIFNAGKKANRG